MHILIVDDDVRLCRSMAAMVRHCGHTAEVAQTGAAFLERHGAAPVDLVLLDMRLGREDGLELLKKARERRAPGAVVVFTAFASLQTAVAAIKLGALDYLPKPCTMGQLQELLERVEKERAQERRVKERERRLAAGVAWAEMASAEESVDKLYRLAAKAAGSDASIMLQGESGTGKNVLARFIHERSGRPDRPFVTVSSPSLSGELFESALFGHVKGSFTGAVSDTWGKVAQAEGGRCFWTRSGSCRRSCSRNCCGCSMSASMSAWGKRARAGRMCGLSRRRTRTSPRRFGKGTSARTCTTGST